MPLRHVEHIDGPCLVAALVSGGEWVASKRLHLNDINVFPVPDGDTGNNLTMTLKAAADAVRGLDAPSLAEVCGVLSKAVLIGARGNAGIIVAQFIRGFAREAHGHERLYAGDLAQALERSARGAYEAMAEPVEGTVLTVIRESVEEVSRLVADGERDVAELLSGMHAAAAKSLERTPELLPVLKEAGVVDAGGEGFVDLLEGMLRMLRGEKVEPVLHSVEISAPELALGVRQRDLKYRYCTEFMLKGPAVRSEDVKAKFAGMGGSLVVVGSPGLVRVHIHTNSPEVAFDVGETLGEVSGRKVDDMREEHREFVRRSLERSREHAAREGGEPHVRIVTDSSADLPVADAQALDITVVPLTISFEDESYRSGVDLTTEEFYDKLEGSWTLPTTSQPSPHDFLQIYEELRWETRSVLSIHISSEMSGTVRSAQTAARLAKDTEVIVVDSRLVSAPLGMVVMEAAHAARQGAQLDDLRELVSDLCSRARVYFTVSDLTYLVRGGRIGRARALLGKVAGVSPILTIEDGVVTVAAKARGNQGVVDSMLGFARRELAGAQSGGGSGRFAGRPWSTLGLVRGRGPHPTEEVRRAFTDEFGFEDVRDFELGGVVGTHAGPGTWGVSYFRRGPGR